MVLFSPSFPPFLLPFPRSCLPGSFFSLTFSLLFFYLTNASRRQEETVLTTGSGVLVSFPPSSRSPIKEEKKIYYCPGPNSPTRVIKVIIFRCRVPCSLNLLFSQTPSPQKKESVLSRAPTGTTIASAIAITILIYNPHSNISNILSGAWLNDSLSIPRRRGAKRLPLRFSHSALEVSG